MSVVRTLIGNVKGPKGDAGSQGPQGVAGTIEIGSVQTVSYGSPASVTNSGTEEEAILDFQIPQGAPGATVTDMSNLVLSSITDSTADYPAFAVSETGSTIFGKIRKFLSDLKNNYVSKAMMTTSTNIDTEGQAVADAKAIKTLNDSLSNLSAVNVYTGSQITFTQYATMYGSSNKVIHYPNLGIVWVHLAFDIGTISSSAWYNIAELPVKIGNVYYADVLIGGLGDVSNNVRRDLHVVGSGGTSLLGLYLQSGESGKRCYIDLCIPTL